MKKRIENLEAQQPDIHPAEYIADVLFPQFVEGVDVSEEVEAILEDHPEWKHNPPTFVGRSAYIGWREFTGHRHVTDNYPGRCPCGFEIPKSKQS